MTITAIRPSRVAGDQLRVRQLEDREWPVLRDMRLRARGESADSFLTSYDAEAAFSDEQWQAEFSRGSWFLASLGIESIGIVGATSFHDIPADDRYLENLWVAEERRRDGVATILVSKVMQRLATDGVHTIWLWILDGNDKAWKFYEKLGFDGHGDPVALQAYPGRSEQRMKFDLLCPLPASPAVSLAAISGRW
jgi:ribosomal protein S18 acetylase RimI-like enzyme